MNWGLRLFDNRPALRQNRPVLRLTFLHAPHFSLRRVPPVFRRRPAFHRLRLLFADQIGETGLRHRPFGIEDFKRNDPRVGEPQGGEVREPEPG